ncbi:PREDICTED: thiamine pyrophosphokinase 2 isoform X3 [Camelina sativa]|uniref:Thiamine pyrophosphokinase n=1 Tax=Camelina sativa TaxID=90675 RepID=A0ABM0WQW0_CAMSA|nr:PREDICTED: thiamine pyrophosphokinase 2 isoform X3 [Camelina sativa]
MSSAMDVMTHSSSFLLPTEETPGKRYALVVLNQNLPRFTPLLWEHAKLRLCADGGANRIYDELPLFFPHEDASSIRHRYKPDVIKGDMDSIRPDVLDFYLTLGTKVIDESHDQDTTDLDKCIVYIRDSASNQETSRILATGALGGRFDHEAGNLNVLYRYPDTRIVLLSDDCLIQLLPKTHLHEIHIHSSLEGPHCGLIPIGTPSAKTTTSGLKWDLSNTEMRFGGLISTSNLVNEEKITVESDSDLLWTISIKKTGLPVENNTP